MFVMLTEFKVVERVLDGVEFIHNQRTVSHIYNEAIFFRNDSEIL